MFKWQERNWKVYISKDISRRVVTLWRGASRIEPPKAAVLDILDLTSALSTPY